MEQPILLSKNHPNYVELKRVIGTLLSFIDADSVYVSSVDNGQQIRVLICLILQKETTQKSEELYSITKGIFNSYPHFLYKIFDSERAAYSFRKGNLFFIRHCSINELVYKNSETSLVFNPTKDELDQLLQKAKKRHIKERDEIHAVSRDLMMFIQNGNHVQVAYILHETIWELYYSASWFLTGTCISSKSINQQQSHISDYSYSLGTVFEKYDDEDAMLLQELDFACDAVCHNFNIAISKEIIPKITAKAELLKEEVKGLFEENLRVCREKFFISSDFERGVEEVKAVAIDEVKMRILKRVKDLQLECVNIIDEVFLGDG